MIGVLGYRGLLGSTICKLHPDKTAKVPFASQEFLDEVLKAQPFDTIINCIGVVPNSPRQSDMFPINSEFPRWLAERCTKYGIRLIHVSTDCVFDGKRGAYVESDSPNSSKDYGMSKAGGEMVYSPHLVVRTSFVGLPDPAGRGLLAWLVENSTKVVHGFRRSMWNGITTTTLADILVDLAPRTRVWGVRHIFNLNDPISKYELLRLANQVYGLHCLVYPIEFPIIDRTLSTMYGDIPVLYQHQLSKSYSTMLSEMENRLGRA